jgi:hypothetical protein
MISPWRAILARLSSPRLFRVPRSRRRARRTLSRSLEGLESRVLLSGGTIPGLPYNDSNLSPPGLQNATAMPNLPVFNVKSYGATGNGTTDDTVAIRNAINAAVSDGGGIIYFPAGTYAVDNQPGDTFSNPLFPAIFTITTSNLVFMGAGANNTTLAGYMPGLKNPVTTWVDTGNSYSQISRFGMFQINSDNAPLTNIQFRSLNIDGDAGYTGNSTVGGNTTTGDGWDMSHKAINMGGENTINNVLVFNCTIDNWRGEEIYGGGNLIETVNIINDDLYGTNADAVSISGNVLIASTTIGGTATGDDVYNGVEDFALGAPQGTIIENSTIMDSSNASDPHGNGVAYLGLATSALTVTNTTFENNQYGILFSETANNVTVENSTFSNNVQGMIDSILGLYPQYPTGFSNFLIEGNTFNDSGSGFLSQAYSASDGPFPDLVLMNNTVTNGSVLIQGAFLGPNWSGFVVEGNTIGSGGEDATNWQGDVGLWSDTTRLAGSTPGMVVNDFASETTTTIAPDSDLVELNYNQNSGSTQLVAISSSELADLPVGFEVTLVPGQLSNWALQANSSWNTFSSNVTIGTGVTIRLGSNGLFSLVSATAASKLAFTQTPTSGTAGTALSPAVQVSVENPSGSVVTSDNSLVTLTIEGGTFAGGATSITAQAVSGLATFSNLIIDAAGIYNLIASDANSYAGASSGLITINPGAAKKVVFTEMPPSGVAGQELDPPVIAAVEDQFGNVISTDGSTVTLTLNGGTFAGGGNTATSSADDGVAIFNDLVINSGGSYTLTASDGSLTGSTSGSLSITGGASSEQLVFSQGPSSATAGAALSPAVQVSVEQTGSVVTSDTSTVTLTLNGGVFAGGGTTITAQAVNGVATFSNLIIDAAGAYTLSASDGSDTGATSSSFTVSAGAASKLVITQSPASGTAGQALGTALTVTVEDAFGNVVSSNTSSVAVSVASGPGVVASTGTASMAAASGVAAFSNLIFDTAGTYTLSVSDGSLTGATSGSFIVSPAAASKLVITQTPTSGTAGQALGTSLKISIEDAFGNVVTSNASTVGVTVASGPGAFASGSTTSVAAASGVASFSNLIFDTTGSYTLNVGDGSLTGATAGTVTVSAAAASKLAITQTPTTSTAGQALGTALKVAVEDAFGNVVTSNGSTVAATVASGPGGFASGSTTSVAAASGVATLSNLIFDTAGSYTLSVSDGSLTGTTSGSFTVNPAAASALSYVQTPASGTVNQALNPSVQVAVKDQFGNVVTSNSSTVTVAMASGPGGFASGSTTTMAAVNGVATFSNLMFGTAGAYTLSVTDGSVSGATSGSIAISASTAAKLAITQTPTAGTAGQALGTALKVAIEDSSGNVVTANASTVTVAVASGPGGFASGSTTSVAAVSGVATFSNLIFNTAGTYTLSISDGSLTGTTSASITVSAGTASKLVITQTPSTSTAGQALATPLKVTVEDAFGNVVTSNTSTVAAAVASGPGYAASGSATSVAASSGVATFSNLIFDTAGTYTLSLSDGSLTGATSGSFTVSPAAASKLAITQTPTTGTAGQALGTALTALVEDTFGNVVTSNSSTVALAVLSGPASFASGSTTSVAAASGVASFSNLIFNTAGSYTLSASDGSLTGATSGSFTVSPAAASKLVISQTPTSGTAGQALGTSLKISVEDAFGNVVSSNGSTVAVTVASGPGSFASSSTTSVAASSGVATFSNLIFDTAGSYTLSVTDGSLTGATSGSVTINPAAASKLSITQLPSTGTAGQALGTALKVSVEDAFGNVVTSNTSTVAVTVASGPGAFAGGSTTSVAAVSGVATFSNLIFNTAGTYTLSISDGSLTGTTTATITISPGAASKLVITQTPASGIAGQALGTALTIGVEDAFGNVVTSNTSTVAVTVASGPAAFAGGSTTSLAAVNGVATFGNLIFNTAGSYTLSVSDGALTGATSGSFTVSPSAASTLSLMQTPASGTVNQALSPSLQVAVKDQFGNVITSNTSSIGITMASGPGGFASGSTTSVSAVNGVATFSNLMLNAAGSYTLSVSDGSLTGATTGTITIGASTGAASKLAITQTPSAGTAGQALGTAMTVAVEDASGNVVTGDSSTVTLTVTSGPGAFANGSTTSAAAVNGVATFSNLIFNIAGTYTVSLSDGSLTGATTGSITISPAAASKLVITQSPTTGTAGQALSPSMTVSLEDAFGNLATNNSSTVTVAVSGGPARLANASTTSVAAANGVATFSGLFLDAVGTYTLSVSDGSLTSANSGNITISAGAASKLFVSQAPVTTTAGQAFNPGVMVAVQDAYGNAVTSGASITLAVNSGPAGFASGSTLSATAVNGVATFSNLILTAAGSYTLSASASSLTSGISTAITVNPAAASKLIVSQAPGNATAGQALNPSVMVAVEDAYGNTVTSNTSTIALSVSSGPAGFASGSTTSATTVNGIATFSNLILDTAGSYTLNASDGALAAAKSPSMTVNAAATSKLVIRQAPTSGTAGKALGTALQVAIEDQFGNVLTSNNSTVSVATNSGPASPTNASTTSVAASNGVATFSNLTFNTAGTYTLKLSVGSLSAVSGNIAVSPAAASKLGFIQTPATGTAGVALNPGIKVAVEDAYGNVVSTNTSKITLVVNTGPDGFASGSTTTVAAVNGVATFSKLLCDRSGSYVIGASDGSLTKAASGSITIAPAAATKLAIIQTPGSGVAGQSLSTLQIAVEDQFGNIVTSNTSSLTVSVSSGGSFANTSTTTVAAVNGIATFSNLIPATKGAYTLKVSDGLLTSAITHSITVVG